MAEFLVASLFDVTFRLRAEICGFIKCRLPEVQIVWKAKQKSRAEPLPRRSNGCPLGSSSNSSLAPVGVAPQFPLVCDNKSFRLPIGATR